MAYFVDDNFLSYVTYLEGNKRGVVQYFKSMTIEKKHVCDSLEEATQI